jgi:hypothetical protein
LLSGGIVFSIYEQMTLVLSGVTYQ